MQSWRPPAAAGFPEHRPQIVERAEVRRARAVCIESNERQTVQMPSASKTTPGKFDAMPQRGQCVDAAPERAPGGCCRVRGDEAVAGWRREHRSAASISPGSTRMPDTLSCRSIRPR